MDYRRTSPSAFRAVNSLFDRHAAHIDRPLGEVFINYAADLRLRCLGGQHFAISPGSATTRARRDRGPWCGTRVSYRVRRSRACISLRRVLEHHVRHDRQNRPAATLLPEREGPPVRSSSSTSKACVGRDWAALATFAAHREPGDDLSGLGSGPQEQALHTLDRLPLAV